jgi:hypothetical protein
MQVFLVTIAGGAMHKKHKTADCSKGKGFEERLKR